MVKKVFTMALTALLGLSAVGAFSATQIKFSDVERMATASNLTIQSNNILLAGVYSSLDDLNKPTDGSQSPDGSSEKLLAEFKKSTQAIKDAEKSLPAQDVAMKSIYLYSAGVGDMLVGMMEGQAKAAAGAAGGAQGGNNASSGSAEDAKRSARATLQKSSTQLQSANAQIVNGAQTLYLGYLQMDRQIREMKANEVMLARSIEVLAVTTEAGQTTELEYESTRAQLDNLAITLEAMTLELKNLALDLGNMLGTYDEVIPTALPDPKEFIQPNLEGDLQKALTASYAVNGAKHDLTGKGKDNPTSAQLRDIEGARIALLQAEKNVNTGVSKLYNSIQSKQKLVTVAQSNQEIANKKLDSVKTKYEAGKVSKTDLLQAQTDVDTSKIKLESARADLVTAHLKYEWLIKGLPA